MKINSKSIIIVILLLFSLYLYFTPNIHVEKIETIRGNSQYLLEDPDERFIVRSGYGNYSFYTKDMSFIKEVEVEEINSYIVDEVYSHDFSDDGSIYAISHRSIFVIINMNDWSYKFFAYSELGLQNSGIFHSIVFDPEGLLWITANSTTIIAFDHVTEEIKEIKQFPVSFRMSRISWDATRVVLDDRLYDLKSGELIRTGIEGYWFVFSADDTVILALSQIYPGLNDVINCYNAEDGELLSTINSGLDAAFQNIGQLPGYYLSSDGSSFTVMQRTFRSSILQSSLEYLIQSYDVNTGEKIWERNLPQSFLYNTISSTRYQMEAVLLDSDQLLVSIFSGDHQSIYRYKFDTLDTMNVVSKIGIILFGLIVAFSVFSHYLRNDMLMVISTRSLSNLHNREKILKSGQSLLWGSVFIYLIFLINQLAKYDSRRTYSHSSLLYYAVLQYIEIVGVLLVITAISSHQSGISRGLKVSVISWFIIALIFRYSLGMTTGDHIFIQMDNSWILPFSLQGLIMTYILYLIKKIEIDNHYQRRWIAALLSQALIPLIAVVSFLFDLPLALYIVGFILTPFTLIFYISKINF